MGKSHLFQVSTDIFVSLLWWGGVWRKWAFSQWFFGGCMFQTNNCMSSLSSPLRVIFLLGRLKKATQWFEHPQIINLGEIYSKLREIAWIFLSNQRICFRTAWFSAFMHPPNVQPQSLRWTLRGCLRVQWKNSPCASDSLVFLLGARVQVKLPFQAMGLWYCWWLKSCTSWGW